MTPVRLTVGDLDFRVRNTRTRFPFRYGIASMTEVPHLFVRVDVEVDGKRGSGLASEGLPPKWFTKDPGTTFEQDLPAMYDVIGAAAQWAGEEGRVPVGFFDWWQAVDVRQRAWGATRGYPGLLLSLGTSLVERAVLDGVCRVLGEPLHRLVASGRLGLRLGELHPELTGTTTRDWLPSVPSATVVVRHTVGLADALGPGEIPPGDRVDDGLPQDLESSVRAYGLRAFKIKLFGDPGRDGARLRGIQSVLQRSLPAGSGVGDCLITLDGNENFRDFGAFRGFWEPVVADPTLSWLRERVVLVEQPVHRAHALSDDVAEVLLAWPGRPALIIDESDGGPGDVRRALELGYAGASHKNCKGVVKGIGNACLLAWCRRRGEPGILTGEDLCNLGPVALLQDLAVMALLGVPHVERNGHHYFRGLSLWPREWQEAAVVGHPDLYQQEPGAWVRLRVERGVLALGSVNAAPFGLGPWLDPAAAGLERAPVSSVVTTGSRAEGAEGAGHP